MGKQRSYGTQTLLSSSDWFWRATMIWMRNRVHGSMELAVILEPYLLSDTRVVVFFCNGWRKPLFMPRGQTTRRG